MRKLLFFLLMVLIRSAEILDPNNIATKTTEMELTCPISTTQSTEQNTRKTGKNGMENIMHIDPKEQATENMESGTNGTNIMHIDPKEQATENISGTMVQILCI
ncbi:hypothetical protein JTB14_024422 [Gonioctena quinquepunctata]|nr:hypothetical protein JTB14_024422 [Gonioctena quinquepunctata]